ncbi:MAG: leucine-rich repeat domain-containing protein [Clostridiales bacterium]|nr:leucine-rich repeat domain-containing protein [Clostridiales bacterium]
MKKYLILVLVIVLALCLTVALTACNVHKHVLSELIDEVPATCADGVKAHYECTGCDALFDENKQEVKASDLVIPATKEHTPELVVGVPQTDCSVAGLTDGYKCAVCGEILVPQEVIPAKAHTFGEWDEVYRATETTSGLKTRKCEVCGQIESQYTDLLPHEWSNWTDNGDGTHTRTCSQKDCQIGIQTETCLYNDGEATAATCLDGGFTTYKCTVCGHIEKREEVSALGHDYGDGKYTADYVGLENLDNHTHTHSRICRRCSEVDTQNCVFSTTEVVQPTCELGGYTKHICAECGSIHEDTLTNATGHDWGQWTYDETTADTHRRTCSNDLTHVETQSCVYVDEVTQPTCNSVGFTTHTCSVCKHSTKDSETAMLQHVFGDWEYAGQDDGVHKHQHTCLLCQTVFKENCKIVNIEQAANCLQSGSDSEVCEVCLTCVSETEIKPLGHNWGSWTDNGDGTHSRVCKNDNSHVEANINHNYTVEVTPADCLNARVDRYTCVDCNSTKTETVGEPLGHSWGAWVVTATEHSRTCLLDTNHREQAAHSWTTTNLCNSCEFDALTYVLMGGSYVVANDNKLPATVKTVIIRSTYTAAGDITSRVVTEIAHSAFYGNSKITSVVLPETLTVINYEAFYNCTSLASVTFGDRSALVTIDNSAFYGCAALESIEIPNSVTTIGLSAFYNCSSLRDVTMPDSVTSIGSRAFYNTALYNAHGNWTDGVLYLNKHLIKADASVSGEYVVANGTITIGWQAFSDCVNLTKISLPATLCYVERDAFLGCLVLTEVEYSGTMYNWFDITFVNDASSPLYYAARLHIEGAIGEIVIPDHVKAIPAGTFRGTGITSVVIPNGVTSIGEEAFENCVNLTSITIPDSVTYIGANAFTGTGYYLNDSNWNNDDGVNGVLYINNHLIAAKADVVTGELTVRDGTITIGVDAFKDCVDITKVTIAASVVRIGAGAFGGCTNLKNVVFANSNSSWMANRVQSISRVVKVANLTSNEIAEQFTFYNGEWKLLNQ